MKTLILHAPSELTEDGRNVSRLGLDMAHGCGAYHYRKQRVQNVYTSPLGVTWETAAAMMVENRAFDNACRHPVVDGLGNQESLMLLFNDQFEDLIKGGVSIMEAFVASHDRDVQHVFEDEAMLAIHEMFVSMADGELGVGIFHEPFIVLAAYACGLRDIYSLDTLESIIFEFRGENNIVAKRTLIS